MKLDSSQRFQLAASLRSNTDAMILLSATPHQGMHDKFQALLELIHPERKDEINTLALNPEILNEMVFRNNKADVTNSNGDFIFKGKTTTAVRVEVSSAAKAFDIKLQKYIKRGYEAGNKLGNKGNAIGFVMTVYRKLAASSIAAIHHALQKRKKRIQESIQDQVNVPDIEEKDERYIGEYEEEFTTEAKEFFKGEIDILDELIIDAKKLRNDDNKLHVFTKELIANTQNTSEFNKVLIFTEYRTTQNYIKEALEREFGGDSVQVINGSMSHQERKKSIAKFEDHSPFLISTEAGGEGINLQRKCHIMVNYDLPWNPMRLVQRIGRLYRYGQEKRVVVFNIHSPGTADEQIIDMMYTRINKVVEDMSRVGDEYNDRLYEDILGEVSDLIDVNQILKDATITGIDRTKDRIDEALARAKDATSKQRELFEYAASFDSNELRRELRITQEHGSAFVLGMFKLLDIEILETSHNGRVWQIRLPELVKEELRISRIRYAVTLDRILAVNRPNIHMLDLDSFLMKFLLKKAKSYEFMGLSAVIQSNSLKHSAFMTSLLRWQNDQGQRRRQEYTVYGIKADNGRVSVNPDDFGEWLKKPARTGQVVMEQQHNKTLLTAMEHAADTRLAEVSNRHLHPENCQWVSGAWVE